MANKNIQQIQNVLAPLLRGAVSYNEKAIDAYSKIGESLLKAEPLQVLGALIGGTIGQASVPSPKEGSEKMLKGTKTEQAIQSGQIADPLLKSGKKKVEQVQGKQIEEAMQQGASADNILMELNRQAIARGTVPGTTNQTVGQGNGEVSGETFPETEIQQPQQQKRNILSSLLGAIISPEGGILGPSPQSVLATRQAQQIQQQMAGEQPLQKGEKEKLAMRSALAIQKELMTAGSVDTMSPESAGKFGLFMEGSQAVTDFATILDESPGVLSIGNLPSFLKSQKGRQFNTALKRAFSSKLRIESGGAITPEEIEEQWKTFAPRKTDSQETIRQKTFALKSYFDRVMNIADPTGIHRQRATGGTQDTALIQAAKEELARRRGGK